MTKREKVSCGRVLAWARVASLSRSLELLLRKITSEFNFRRLKSHRALINNYCATVERVKAKHPPPAQKGEVLPWTVLGRAAGQGTHPNIGQKPPSPPATGGHGSSEF